MEKENGRVAMDTKLVYCTCCIQVIWPQIWKAFTTLCKDIYVLISTSESGVPVSRQKLLSSTQGRVEYTSAFVGAASWDSCEPMCGKIFKTVL